MYSFQIKEKIDKKKDKIIAEIIPENKKSKLKQYICLVESEYKRKNYEIVFDEDAFKDLLVKYTDKDERLEIIENLKKQFYKTVGIEDNDNKKTEIILNEGRMKICPIFNKFQVYYLYGASGSGKSYIARDIAEQYIFFNPKNGVYLISKLQEDDTLDKAKFIKRINADTFKKDKPNAKEFSDSLVIIDDYEAWESSDRELYDIIISLINDISTMGRHEHINLVLCNHNASNYRATRTVLSEATGIIIYPQSSGDGALKYLLQKHCGLDTNQINKIKKAKSRWVYVNKHAPRYMMTNYSIEML